MQRGIKPYGQYSVKPSVRLIPLQTPAVYVVQGFAEILSAGDSDLVKSQEILLPRERKLRGPFPLVSGSFKVIPFAVLIARAWKREFQIFLLFYCKIKRNQGF